MYRIAFKMLAGDRGKYLLLISAISFSVLLMTHQCSVFFGLMRWNTAIIRNMQIPLWIVDPLVEQPDEILPLLHTDLGRVRSIEGVKWAVPASLSIQLARLDNRAFKSIQLIGLDTATLIGAPSRMIAGDVEDLWQDGAVIIDEVGLRHFSAGKERPVGIGDRFDINDHEVRVVGICKVEPSFFGLPYVYTTFDRALQITPPARKNLAFVLAAPDAETDASHVARTIENQTGLKAFTADEFSASTIRWLFKNTGMPISFGITVMMGFLVGIAVSGQTFYSFILENFKHLGALKAMGASTSLLCKMLILQAFVVGFIGYGIGIGLTSIFGHMAIGSSDLPFFMPYEILWIPLMAVCAICLFATGLGIYQIRKLDAAEVFRG
jgi:putative ABC transport system permease protein